MGALIALHAAGHLLQASALREVYQIQNRVVVISAAPWRAGSAALRLLPLLQGCFTEHLTLNLLQVLAQAARQQQEQQAKQPPPPAPAAPPAAPPAQPQTVVHTQEPDPVLLYKLERVERQVGPQHGS